MNYSGKPYGFKISDGKVTYTKWFSSDGTTDGIPTGNLHNIIVAQHYLLFHHALAYCKIAAKERGFEFTELYEKDYRKEGNPIKNFFKKIFKK